MTRLRVFALFAGVALGFIASYVPSTEASRNASGTYSLPAGNPVVTGTTITSTWANTTLSDLGTEITSSLDRNGKGGMLASLRLANGTSSAPSVGWTSETNSGLYRNGAGDIRMVVGASNTQRWSSTGTTMPGTLDVTGLSTLTGGARGPNGSYSAPAYSFTSETNSGLYRNGTADLRMSVVTADPQHWTSTGVVFPLLTTMTGAATAEAGLTVTQSTTNGQGVVGTGNGTGNGLVGTGGASSGSGGYFTGGAPNGRGLTTTGTGTGRGLLSTGGSSDGTGGAFVGGATNGIGMTATGSGTGVGAQLSNGTAATGATRRDAASLTNGDLDLSGVTDPDSTTSVSDRITPLSFAKGWARFTGNNTANPTINGGLNITSVTQSTGGGTDGTYTVTIAGDMAAAASYAVIAVQENGGYPAEVGARAAGSFTLRFTDGVSWLTAAQLNNIPVSLMILGAQ